MTALDEWFDKPAGAWAGKLTILSSVEGKIARFCVEYALSPQQSRVVEAMLHGALSNEALGRRLGMRQWTLRKHLDRIAQKTMTRRGRSFCTFVTRGAGANNPLSRQDLALSSPVGGFFCKNTQEIGMVQFWVAASSAAPRLSLPKAWGWQNSQSGATIPIPRG